MIKTWLITSADIITFGIRSLLADCDDISLVMVTDSLESYPKDPPGETPDVVIVDVQSINAPRAPSLKSIAAILRNDSHHVGLIGLTDWTNKSRFEFACALGANGFCLKTIKGDELCAAVRAAARGETYIHDDYRALIEANSSPLFDTLFGKRQLEILDLMAKGHTNKEIAAKLQLSVETVKSHIKIILKKLDAKDRSHAISLVLNETINVLTQQNLYFNSASDVRNAMQAKRIFSTVRK